MSDEEIKRMRNEIGALRDLIQHMHLHSAYKRCGYDEMTKKEQELFNEVISGPYPFESGETATNAPTPGTTMSKDRINIPTTWLADRAAHYRNLQRIAKDSVDYADIRQMAWAFEFVLEEWWRPSPLIQKMHELSVSDGLTPETVTLLKMAIEAQETGKMPPLPITLQPMPTAPCQSYLEDGAVCDDVGEPKGQCVHCGFKEHQHTSQSKPTAP